MIADDSVSSMLVHAHVFDSDDVEQVGCVEVDLEHRTSDPYAIHMHISTPTGVVTWVMSREILDDALESGAAGYGDVQVFAEPLTGDDLDQVRVRLESPEGCAWIHYLRADLEQFMIVIPEQRAESIDWDSIIRQINES